MSHTRDRNLPSQVARRLAGLARLTLALGLLASACGRASPTAPAPTAALPSPTSTQPTPSTDAVIACEVPARIPCEDRVVHLAVEIPGTGLHLQYASNRIWDAVGMGGWTLDVLDSYDPASGVETIGAGRPRSVDATQPTAGPSAGHLLIASPNASEVSEFDTVGRHLTTRDALTGGVLRTFEYDASGRLASVADAAGNATTIERDPQGAPQAIVGPNGFRTGLHLSSDGFLAGIVPQGRPGISMTTDSHGLITEMIDAAGDRHAFAYDGDGRLTQYTDPDGAVTTLAPASGSGSFVVTTPLGRRWVYTAEVLPDGGLHRTVVGPAGDTTDLMLAADETATITYPSGLVRVERRSPDPRWGMQAPTLTSLELSTPGGLHWTQSATLAAALHDPADPFSLSSLTAERTAADATYRRVFDAATNTIMTTGPDGRLDRVELDEIGRPVTSQRGNLAALHYAYDELGRLLSVTIGEDPARAFNWTYDDALGLVSVRNPLGEVARVQYDDGGSPIWYAAGDGAAVSLRMDGLGQLVSLSPPGHAAYAMRWSPTGVVTTLEGPTPEGESAAAPVTRSLDPDGHLAHLAGPLGTTAGLSYDEAGRLQSIELGEGALAATYEGASTRLQSLVGPANEGIRYDWDGPLMVRETWTGPVAGFVERSFDDAFHLAQENINGDFPAEYVHDSRGRTVRAGELSLEYGELERPSTVRLGSLVETWTYDETGVPISHTVTAGGTAVYGETEERDALGRVVQQAIQVDGASSTSHFAYDAAGRLGSIQAGADAVDYAYDLAGNRVGTTTGGVLTPAAFDNLDRQETQGATSYRYDDAGRLLGVVGPEGTTSLRYDSLGRLIGADLPDGRRLDYELDGLGRRVGVSLDGTMQRAFLYADRLRPIAELDAAGNVISRFVYSADGPVPEYMVRDGRTYAIITDQLGSVRVVVDAATGEVAQRLDYDAFGRVLTDTAPGFQPFAFAGGMYEPLTRLVHFGVREYDPATGRFTTPDPLAFVGGDTNLYRYAQGDPVNRVDPTGADTPPTGDEPAVGEPPDHSGLPDTFGYSLGFGVGAGPFNIAFGVDLQYFNGHDWAVYTYTPAGPGAGYSLGAGLSANAAWQQGEPADNVPASWKNIFETAGVGVGPVAYEQFRSRPATPGWSGYDVGLGKGPLPFSDYKNVTNYACLIGCGSANGDPHVRTGDGLAYEFQAAGEFVAVESEAGDLSVQIRTEPYGRSTVVSIVTATALYVAGDRVAFYAGDAIEVRLSGVPTQVTTPISLAHGGRLERTEAGYRVTWPDGSTVDVGATLGRALDVIVDLSLGRRSDVRGLLGDQDDTADNDLTTREGRPLTLPDLHAANYADVVYGTFAESWRLRQAESLFDYRPGESTASFTVRDFPSAVATADTLAPDQRLSAETTCRRSGVSQQPFLDACVIDVGLTGEAGFASSAARAQGRTMPPSPTRAFSVDLGDLVAPDRPVAGAGRLASSEEIHEYSFPVRAGQSWYLAAAPSCDVEGLRWSLVGPDGSPIRDALGGTDEPLCVDLGRFTADEDGSYTVRVRAAEGTPAGGEFGFVLTPVRPDIRATITIGDSVSTDDPVPGAGRLEVPGAIHRYSFNASAGDVIYLRTAGCAQGILVWRLFGPAGRPLPTYRQQTCLDLGRMDISVAGTYTVVVGEGGPATGSYGFALLRVGPDGAFAIQPGDIIAEGRPGQGAGRIETPGSLDRYAFSAEAGDLITVANLATGTASCSGLRWDLLDPNGSPLYVDQILCAGAERPAIAAPTSGIYVLRVRGAGASVGTYGMRVVTTH